MQNISVSDQPPDDGWETASTASTPSTPEYKPPSHHQSTPPVRRHRPPHPPKDRLDVVSSHIPAAASSSRQAVLDQYWIERAKFIKHLEKRSKKFAKRSKEDYDAARWGKEKSRPAKTPASAAKPAKRPKPPPATPSPLLPTRPAQKVAPPPTASHATLNLPDESNSMIASTSKGVVRVARTAQVAQVARASAASFSTSAPAMKNKQKKDPDAMDVFEAARVLRALEITKPSAAYSLHLQLKLGKNNKAPSIRGRVTLPRDPRRSSDVILVFAEPNSKSAQLARDAGVEYVGATELIDALLAGEIHPTKVLTTPGMLPTVTGRLARFLGPKGLMPTARRGGVGEGEDLVERIKEAKGAMDWKTDEKGRVRSPVGRVSFSLADVESNIKVVVKSVRDGMTTTSNNSLDEHLVSKRAAQAKQSAGITAAYLESSSGPRIVLRDF